MRDNRYEDWNLIAWAIAILAFCYFLNDFYREESNWQETYEQSFKERGKHEQANGH